MNILFYDVVTPVLYTQTTLLKTGLGGTESTIIRIAHALKNYHNVYIAQHCRNTEQNVIEDGVHYISLETANTLNPDVVILLRYYSWLERIGKMFPRARCYFWMHNMPSKSLYTVRDILVKYQYQILAVSHFHRNEIERRVNGKWYQRLLEPNKKKGNVPIHTLYNPIDDFLTPNETKWQPDQMILASSPYKGINENLKMFQHVLKYFPDYKLNIATYADWNQKIKLPEQVTFLGSLSHSNLIQHIRESFCVFYPQPVRCETFGLVYAESNAVGTPVLGHDFGAASEVLTSSSQLIDGFNPKSVLAKIQEWRNQRPALNAQPQFKLTNVIKTWLHLLNTFD